MMERLRPADLLILDLFSECRPMWGIPSIWQRPEGYGPHHWLFCMLENFGANVGLHGRMDQLLHNFYETRTNPLAAHLKGIGLTMEGIENNPVMFELMTELPWRAEPVTKEEWIRQYARARYGADDPQLLSAWTLLARTLYNCPAGNNQQGPHESIFCGRPTLNNFQASSWSKMQNYYDPAASAEAARQMLAVADRYRGQNHFEYDLVDVVRQAVADRARREYQYAVADYKAFHRQGFERHSRRFLRMLSLQDSLLATRSEFRVGRWLQQARSLGTTEAEKDLYEWNARVQITTWGNRPCADDGGLRDYAHKEWSGLLRDFYLPRWQAFFGQLRKQIDGAPEAPLDYYAMEEPWTLAHNPYTAEPEGDCVDVARAVFQEVMNPENDD
jgi:alpha-N-acetylglucosaminidase